MGLLGCISLKEVGEDGRADDEGRPILERVDLMQMFFADIRDQI